jgi:DNA-3-methyladenine glycosylase I
VLRMIEENVVGDDRVRCFGGPNDPLMMRYHDEQWGFPVHDDRQLFESFVLDGFQAGLSWRTILHKRENFRKAFLGFDPEKVTLYGDSETQRLLADAGIVRNRMKIVATISNAGRFLEVQGEFGSFDSYLWRFTGGETLRNPDGVTMRDVPASTPESDALSADLKGRGFKFVGTTICYAVMQSVGMVNDHSDECWRTSVD